LREYQSAGTLSPLLSSPFFLAVNATHTNLERASEAAWRKTSKPPKRLFGNAPAYAPREAGEGAQALANARAHPFDYLRATRAPTPFFFLRNSLFFSSLSLSLSLYLFWQKRRKVDEQGLKHIKKTCRDTHRIPCTQNANEEKDKKSHFVMERRAALRQRVSRGARRLLAGTERVH